jgi:molybdenum-dependent DNA-binding transcriptional regulator ModE
MTRQSNAFTRDLEFLIKKRGYTVESITAAAKERGWTFTQAVMLIAQTERG